MSLPRTYRAAIEPRLLEELAKLPDFALVRLHASLTGGFYGAISLPAPEYVSDPDFSRKYATSEAAIKHTAKFIRDDLHSTGKYAPHFSSYDVEYRLLPHWRKRASSSREAP